MKILFLCHAHPELQAGGTEIFSHALFHELRARGADGLYVAGTAAHQRPQSPGTALQTVGSSPYDQLLWTAGFDTFSLSQTDLHGVMPELSELINGLQPDIVHIHHVLQLGLEVIGLVRRLAPQARIVMTLHDYYTVCANDGQLTTTAGLLCHGPSIDACRRCFPERTAAEFKVRNLHVAGAMAQVDRFIAPSASLREHYIGWGVDPERISLVPNGLAPVAAAPYRNAQDGCRNRFAFFGHINRFKGATIALGASARLERQHVVHSLVLHGGTAFQPASVTEAFASALAAAPSARHAGSYSRADQARLMASADWVVVPSIWWENAPLVIQEAFQHGRPVICSDVGGMAEMVHDGVDGLHAGVGDPDSLASAMRRGIEEPGLWERLCQGIVPPRTIGQSADDHMTLYRSIAPPLPAQPSRLRHLEFTP
jgi:glycosyltransferase involved in cell wall biosynthesis